MATRFYFPSLVIWPAPAYPTPDAGWEVASGMGVGTTQCPTHLMMSSVPSPSAAYATLTGARTGTGAVAGPADVVCRCYLSAPLVGNQTITGTVKGQIPGTENNAAADATTQISIRVVSGDGATVRGTSLALHTNALSSELTATGTNRKNPLAALSPVTLGSVSALDGDRILVEIGVRKNEAGTTSRNYSAVVGTDNATDFPEDETTTTANNSWLEFSQTLTLADMPPRVGSLGLMGVGY